MRKVLSFVLVLSLVLSSFSMAFAADTTAGLTDINGIANEDAIQVAYDLGIVTGNPDGTFLPEKAVTRAEFAAMLTRALDIPDSALAGYTSTSFKDTAGYSWAVSYLAFCQSKGILLGDGAGNVMPGRTVSVNEAMTMALRAIGYTANSSLLVGTWPANYVSIAQNSDLYDDVAKTTTVNKASAAQIIYNLLTVQKVAVNSDGTTDYLWDGDEDDGIEANLLNTNLGCTEDEDVILGADYDYDDAIINITDDIGAFGTAYLNDDDELVAFTKDSVALTGSLNDDLDGFEVGDVTYDIDVSDITDTDNDTTESALFVNTDSSSFDDDATIDDITSWAAINANDGETVTLNVDLSGKKIKDVYSVVAWTLDYEDSDAALAEDDVQDDIADSELLGASFVENDDDAIDTNSFALVGVTSLDKIAEDNVVYVYTDDDGDIRRVEVGTEIIEGTVEEVDTGDGIVTIAGKDYDMAPYPTVAAVTVTGASPDIDEDSEGTFYLDVNGEIYDFDGTNSADTYGVVKAAENEDAFDNFKVKLYKSDDSTTTYYLSEDDPADIDWTSPGAATTIGAVTKAALIGYSLDANGDIDTIDSTVKNVVSSATFQSAKVFKADGVSYDIDSEAVVFTYDTSMNITDDYDVCDLSDVETGALTTSSGIKYILNDDGEVAALFINVDDTDAEDDAIYAVVNKRTTTKDADDETVYKFSGFIDGAAFSYKTDDSANGYASTEPQYVSYSGVAGGFGVYSIILDSSDLITKIGQLEDTYLVEEASGLLNDSGYKEVISDLDEDNTVVTTADGEYKYTIADDAVVYVYDEDDAEFSVSKISSIDEGDTIKLYDTKDDDADGIASVVIYTED